MERLLIHGMACILSFGRILATIFLSIFNRLRWYMNNKTYTPNTEPSPRKSHATKLWIPIILLAIVAVYLIFSDNSIKICQGNHHPNPTDRAAITPRILVIFTTAGINSQRWGG